MIQLNNPIWGKLNTLSASRINSFFRCGIRFHTESVDRIRFPGGIKLHRGNAIHKAIEKDNKNFMNSGTRLGQDELLEIGQSHFETSLLSEGVFIPQRDIEEKDALLDKARAEIVLALKLYFGMEKPWVPVEVEAHRSIDVGYPLPVVSYIDMVDEDNTIWDWKAVSKNMHYGPDIQDYLYTKVYETEFGIRPSFKYCKFVLTKTPYVDIQKLRAPKNYALLDLHIELYFDAIEKNIFLPASSSDTMCSEPMCPFFLICDYRGNS